MNVERTKTVGKVGMAIRTNHSIRAAVTAMQDIFRRILTDDGIREVDKAKGVEDEFLR